MASVPRYYWDACVWIELITQQNPDRVRRCKYVIQLAESGNAEIWTSAFTLAEVYKRKCENSNAALPAPDDRKFEDFIEQPFIKKAAVDVDVGTLARRLLRSFPELKKPQDAVHLATCLLQNLDEMHTFDEDNLLPLDGKIKRKDKLELVINQPPAPPKEAQIPLPAT